MWLSGTGGERMRQRLRSQKSGGKKKKKNQGSKVKILDKRSNSNRKPRTTQQAPDNSPTHSTELSGFIQASHLVPH